MYNKQERCRSRRRASAILNVTPWCPMAFFVYEHTLGHAAALGMVRLPSAGRRGEDKPVKEQRLSLGWGVRNSADAADAAQPRC